MDSAQLLSEQESPPNQLVAGYPQNSWITEELLMPVDALLRLFHTEAPLVLPVQPINEHELRYVGRDALAEGFSWVSQYPDLRVEKLDSL